MTDDITHNLTVVREALEAEGLGMHVKLIDAAIEDSAGLLAQIAACNTLLDRQAQMLKHAPAAAVIERIAAANSAEPETDDLTVPLAIQLSQTEHQLASARKALEPFAAKFDAVDALYRKRGGNPDVFKDAHPSFDVKAEELRIGVWRAAKAALTSAYRKEE
jgi:hypothetical protein